MVQPPGLFDGEGVVALLRATDWASTPLGIPDGWTPALRSMVRLVLHAPVPACLLWGDDLVQLYNDASAAVPAFDPDSPGLKGLEPQLRTALTEDILSQYIARVQDEVGVSINEAAVRLAVGGSDQN